MTCWIIDYCEWWLILYRKQEADNWIYLSSAYKERNKVHFSSGIRGRQDGLGTGFTICL